MGLREIACRGVHRRAVETGIDIAIEREDGGPDAFVHISAVERAGMAGLDEGQRVSFELELDRRGKQAAINLNPL